MFPPANEAFADLPAGTVQNRPKPKNNAEPVKILEYHVVPGDVLDPTMGDATQANGVMSGLGHALMP